MSDFKLYSALFAATAAMTLILSGITVQHFDSVNARARYAQEDTERAQLEAYKAKREKAYFAGLEELAKQR